MTKLQLPEGFGLAEVQIGDREAVKLDLWEVKAEYSAIVARHEGDALKVYADFGEFLAKRGLPGLPHGSIEALIVNILGSVEELKKNALFSTPSSPTPGSAASTDSTAPDSPAP